MRIAFVEQWPHLQNNQIFLPREHILGSHCELPYKQLRIQAAQKGIQIDTYDAIEKKDEIGLLVFVDLPRRKNEVRQMLATSPGAKTCYWTRESPYHHPGAFNQSNLRYFDHVATYNLLLCAEPSVSIIPIPWDADASSCFSVGAGITNAYSFENKKFLACIATNKSIGWLRSRCSNTFWGFLGVKGWDGSGWKVDPFEFIFQHSHNNYKKRECLLSFVDREYPSLLDLWGKGWMGEKTQKRHVIFSRKRYQCARGPTMQPTSQILANYKFALCYENHSGVYGYITEKIFDAMSAGVVPVYSGHPSNAHLLSRSGVVFAHDFASHYELVDFLVAMPYSEWLERVRSSFDFLRGPGFECFSSQAFVNNWLSLFKRMDVNGSD